MLFEPLAGLEPAASAEADACERMPFGQTLCAGGHHLSGLGANR